MVSLIDTRRSVLWLLAVLLLLPLGCKVTPNPIAVGPDGRIAVALTPDGGYEFLTGADRNDIYLTDTTGGSAVRVTDRAGTKNFLAFSPDGERLLFVEERARICTVPVAGGEVRVLAEVEGEVWFPAWSPDGRQIAYHRTADIQAPGSLEVVPTEGGEPRTLVADASFPGVSWLPKSGRIVGFLAEEGSEEDGVWRGRLASFGPEGGAVQTITRTGVAPVNALSVSHEGGRILHGVLHPAERMGQLFLSGASGRSRAATEVEARTFDFAPAWAPDGQRFAFTRSTDPEAPLVGALFVGDAKTGAMERVWAEGVDRAAWPVWLDDRRLAYTGGAEGFERLYMQDLTTKVQVDLGARLAEAARTAAGRPERKSRAFTEGR